MTGAQYPSWPALQREYSTPIPCAFNKSYAQQQNVNSRYNFNPVFALFFVAPVTYYTASSFRKVSYASKHFNGIQMRAYLCVISLQKHYIILSS